MTELETNGDNSATPPAKTVNISRASITEIEDNETAAKEAHNSTAEDEQSARADMRVKCYMHGEGEPTPAGFRKLSRLKKNS